MTAFTDAESDYLEQALLGRLATLGPDGAPQTRPVGFTFNRTLGTIDIGGMNMAASQKYRNVERDGRVSFVVDDLASTKPWRPRGVEIRGHAEPVIGDEGRPGLSGEFIRVRPERVIAWGLDTNAFEAPNSRTITDS